MKKKNEDTMDNSSEAEYIRTNVLSVPEVADALHLTKQRIYALIKAGQLKPAKSDAVTLITASELNRFISGRIQKAQPKNSNSRYIVYFDAGTSKIKGEEFWEKYKKEIDFIYEIRIYANTQDAAVDGYYMIARPGFVLLHYYDAPSLIIKGNNGVSLWLESCNCGFDGTGPNETVRILLDAQKSGLLKLDNSKADWEKFIFCEKKCIISLNEEETLICYAETESILGRDHKISYWQQLLTSTVQIFAAEDGGLVLVQSENPTFCDEIEKAHNLQIHMDFMPKPVSYSYFLTQEDAMKSGYCCPSRAGKITGYQLVLYDATGRQIWIEAINSCPKLSKKEIISDLLAKIGYELPFDMSSMPGKDINWLGKTIEITRPLPVRQVFVDS